MSIDPSGTELKMNWLSLLLGIAIAHVGQNAVAKNRLTDPVKIDENAKRKWIYCARDFVPVGSAS